MLPTAGLAAGISFWLHILCSAHNERSYASGMERRRLLAHKCTIYIPLFRDEYDSGEIQRILLSNYFKSIIFVFFYPYTGGFDDWDKNLVFHWRASCGEITTDYTIRVNRTGGTFRTDIDQRKLGPARFRVYKASTDGARLLHLSISTPVSLDLIGLHTFSLVDHRGNTILYSRSMEVGAPRGGEALPKAFKFCNGDPKLCYAFILPNNNNRNKSDICRRISSARLEFVKKRNQTAHLSTSPSITPILIVSVNVILYCIGAVVFTLNLKALVNYHIRRRSAFIHD